jgi:hypothetical protein
MEPKEILDQLKYYNGILPRQALAEAARHKEEIAPELINTLDFLSENPEFLVENPDYMAHMYAIYLLAEFREKNALPALIKFFSVPGELIHNLTGDLITEDLTRILTSVYDGNTDDLLKSMIENRSVNPYVRAAGINCLVNLVAVKQKSREEVISYFKKLFNGKLERKFSYVWNALVAYSIRLRPEEIYSEIKEAYADDLVESFFVSMKNVEEALKESQEDAMEYLMSRGRYGFFENTLKEMETWPCFRKSAPNRPREKKKKKIGRNDLCPCGSGKKYKKCCGV